MSIADRDPLITPVFNAPDRFRSRCHRRQRGRDDDGHGLFRAEAGDQVDTADDPEDESAIQLAAALQQFYDEV